jgi:hypothetical protein
MTFRPISERRSCPTRRHWRRGKTLRRSRATSGSAGPSPSRRMRQGGSMSKGFARNSKKGCGGPAAGQAARIGDILWSESRPALMFELRARHRLTGNNAKIAVPSGLAIILPECAREVFLTARLLHEIQKPRRRLVPTDPKNERTCPWRARRVLAYAGTDCESASAG